MPLCISTVEATPSARRATFKVAFFVGDHSATLRVEFRDGQFRLLPPQVGEPSVIGGAAIALPMPMTKALTNERGAL